MTLTTHNTQTIKLNMHNSPTQRQQTRTSAPVRCLVDVAHGRARARMPVVVCVVVWYGVVGRVVGRVVWCGVVWRGVGVVRQG